MKQTVAILAGFTLIVAPAIAQSKSDQAQIVSSAEIIKIDAKKKSLQVRDLMEPVSTGARGRGAPRTDGRRGGGGYPGGGRSRRGGGGYPGGSVGLPGGGGYPGGGGGDGAAPPKAKEYKVFVGKDTIM